MWIKSLLQHSVSSHCFKFLWGQVLLPTRAPERWERWERVPSQFEILAATSVLSVFVFFSLKFWWILASSSALQFAFSLQDHFSRQETLHLHCFNHPNQMRSSLGTPLLPTWGVLAKSLQIRQTCSRQIQLWPGSFRSSSNHSSETKKTHGDKIFFHTKIL